MYTDDAISPDSLNKYIGKGDTPQAMKAVAKSLEAVFAYELVKEMHATAMADNKDFASQTYSSMFDMQLANLWAQQGMGLENVIIKQLEREKPKEKPEDSSSKPSETNEKIDTTLPSEVSAPGTRNAPGGPAPGGPAAGGPAAGGLTHVPVKGAAGGKTEGKIKDMIRAAFGGQASNAMTVVAAESSGNPGAVHFNAFYGSTDYGLFQINDRYWADLLERNGIINNVTDLLDPRKNIEAAAWIYRRGGWGQWTSVRSGRVRLVPPDDLYADNYTR
ncbi:MAG: transglycosylase SLT domain-containing protein [Nitrospiraceae bacterium]|nr:transglycosylase SLT domain-containing protein [Nitrospiraceae bacterium]